MTQTKNLVFVLVVVVLLAGGTPSLVGAEPASPDRAPISFASLLEEMIDRDRLATGALSG